VVKVLGYRLRGPVFNSWCYQIFCEIVVLEPDQISFVRINEELLKREIAAAV
jgi:hypothetical protein